MRTSQNTSKRELGYRAARYHHPANRPRGGGKKTVDFLRKRLPSQVGRYLEGVQFPARKEELLGRLERNGVPGPVISQLRKRLPEGEYRSPQDVLSALRRGR